MEDRALELLEAKVAAQHELISNLFFRIFQHAPIREIDRFTKIIRENYEAVLTHPGRKAPSEFIRHATLHELEEFARVFRQALLFARGEG